MTSLRRFFPGNRSGSQRVRRQQVGRNTRLRGLEHLEGRLLLNSHPAGALPEHIHPHLAIFVDGQNFEIPASIGHTFPGPIRGTFNENAHTHTNDGIIHYNEATAAFRDLKEFFDTWGAVFSQSQLKLPTSYNASGQATAFLERNVDASHTIRFFVNGAPSTDFEEYEPEDGDQIVISYEALPAASAPRLNPINNVTMLSNQGSGAPDRTFFVPLDASDPANSPLTYTVTSSNSSVIATLEPGSNPFLRLNVSGRDIDGSAFTGDLILQLFNDLAPNTVEKIVSRVHSGFYDNNFVSTLSAAQEVPPTNSTARGTATLVFDPTSNTFDIDVRVQGITLAQLLPSHIHNGAPGVDGPNIIDLGGASQWVVDGSAIRRTMQDVPIAAADVPALLNNNLYINIHTIANPDGEIRGQITHIPFHRVINDFMAQGGSRTGDGASDTTVSDFADEFNVAATFTGFGQLATANSGDDTNDTQFFITDSNLSLSANASSSEQTPKRSLNFQHAIFGQLVSGFDTFNKIMLTPVSIGAGGERSAPNTPVTINSAEIISDTQHGVLRLSVPANFTGSSTVTVSARNASNQSAVRSFVTTVIADTALNPDTMAQEAVNDRPFLGTITDRATHPATEIVLPLPATDLENDSLTFVIRDPDSFSSQPANVTVSIDQTARQARLTPVAGFLGTIDLLVGVRDETRRVDTNGDGRVTSADNLDTRGNFDTQRIRLTVTNANIAPTANPQSVQYQLNTAATLQLSGDDGDPGVSQTLTFIIETLPTAGTLRDSAQNVVTAGAVLTSPSLTYTPNSGSTATDQFTFRVRDNGGTADGGQDTSSTATVTLNLQANQSPTANSQTLNYQPASPLSIQLSGSDGDPGVDQTLTFIVDSLPARGTLRDSANNVVTVGAALPSATVTYTPEAGFNGSVQFNFHVRDNGGTSGGGDDTSNPATISLRGSDSGAGGQAHEPSVHDRVLRVRGTRQDDIVTVDLNTAGDMIEVVVNGAAPAIFPLEDVERIRIRLRAGNDQVTVSQDVELPAIIFGGRGDDILTGGAGADVIRGRRGDDIIDGGGGSDRLFGGRGADEIGGGAGNDFIWGRRGADSIDGGAGDDEIHGGRGADDIDGGAGTDIGFGGRGDDQFTNVEDMRGGGNEGAVAAVVRERATRLASIDALTPEQLPDSALGSSPTDSSDSVRTDELGAGVHSALVDAALESI
jgi:cyclophilin family peptidyl-prolyl cis-trans isomerase